MLVRHLAIVLGLGVGLAPTVVHAKAKPGRFAVYVGGKLVIDRSNGLVWARAQGDKALSQADATKACKDNAAGLAGTGWRLPSRAELLSLVDSAAHDPAIDAAFAGTAPEVFWSASAVAKAAMFWAVDFKLGTTVQAKPETLARVRCVR